MGMASWLFSAWLVVDYKWETFGLEICTPYQTQGTKHAYPLSSVCKMES